MKDRGAEIGHTPSEWLASTCVACFLATSQMRAVLSLDPDTSRTHLPDTCNGSHARLVTGWVWPTNQQRKTQIKKWILPAAKKELNYSDSSHRNTKSLIFNLN